MAVLMLCALCVPAFAENEPTEVKPEGSAIGIHDAGNYIIKGDYSVTNLSVGTFNMHDITLTIPKGVTVTLTRALYNFGTINVCGTLIISDAENSKINSGTINIMSCGGGKVEGTFDTPGTVNTYDEHNFENDKCTYCGTYKCELTGNHNYNSGVCSVCGTKGCEIGELEHNWVNGVCSACNVKGCEIGQLNHNWVNGVCSVCDKHCEHKWDTATGKCTVCELVCTHGGDKCDICGKELVNLNTGSALSEGNMAIIIGIVALVIGLGGGFFIGRKKKPALASGADNTDEE